MKQLLGPLLAALREGDAAMLVSVLSRQGSAPRGEGAAMLVLCSGEALGTVGGGRAEYEAQRQAASLLAAGEDRVETYRYTPNEVADLGMICGGTVELLFHFIAPSEENIALFARLAAACGPACHAAAYLARRIEHGRVTETGLADGAGQLGLAGFAVRGHGTARPKLYVEGDGFVFVEPVHRPGRLYLFGGGHVSQALCPALAKLDFRVTVYEDRPEFLSPERFPDAEALVLGPFDGVLDKLPVGAADYCVVMTRGHLADVSILRQLLSTKASYIGCIGSRRKTELTKTKLLAEGFTEADFARVHAPIGLPIGAETPDEIAVSVAAQLIAHRAGQTV